jgi:hypothetical protein
MLKLLMPFLVGTFAGLAGSTALVVQRAKSAALATTHVAAPVATPVATGDSSHAATPPTKSAPATTAQADTLDAHGPAKAAPVPHANAAPAVRAAAMPAAAVPAAVPAAAPAAAPASVAAGAPTPEPAMRAATRAAASAMVSKVAAAPNTPSSAPTTAHTAAEQRLAKVFAAMPARDAARILEQMDDRDVRVILGHMGDRQLAGIIASFPPARAAALGRASMRQSAPVTPAVGGSR